MIQRTLRRNTACLMLIVAAVICIPAAGQIVTGSISGAVFDASGMGVPAARIALTQVATGLTREGETDLEGRFYFGGLEGGEYNLSVSKTGFKTGERKSIMLATGDRLRLERVVLDVGSLAETVTVTEKAGAVVQTETGERSDVITSDQVENLLVVGRNINALVRLVPGVVDNSVDDSLSRSQTFNVMGNRQRTNSISIDGVTATESDAGGQTKFTVGQDAVAEVKVLVSNYQAEYGRTAGANVIIVTKSGTRQFHGMASYFKRHEQFNAGSFFDNRDGKTKPRYRYNTWTYNLGGPVYLPGKFNKDRDKLFFFWQQEFWPSRVGTIGRRTMPTALERDGDFSQTVDLNNRMIVVNDPTTRAAFPGNRIPISRLDPSGRALLKLFAMPNSFDRSITQGQYNYVFMQEQNRPKRAQTLKLEYNINSRNILTGSLNGYKEDTDGPGSTGTNTNWPQIAAKYSTPGLGSTVRYTRVFSPTMINEFHWGWMHNTETQTFSDDELRRNQRDAVGFVAGQLYPQVNPLKIVPNATFGGVTGAPTLSLDGRFPFDFMLNVVNWDDKLTLIRKAHTLKAGVYVEKFYRDMPVQGSLFNSTIDFGRNVNNPLDTNYAFSNAALGVFNSYTEASARPRMHARVTSVEMFVQDNWKVTRRLTLDYGLRAYITPPIHDRDDLLSGLMMDRFDPKKEPKLIQPGFDSSRTRIGIDPVTGKAYPAVAIGALAPSSGDPFNGLVVPAQDKTVPRALSDSRGVQWGPRFGYAYDVFGNGKTALRGGFGVFYNREAMANGYKWFMGQPPLVVNPVLEYGYLSNLSNYSGLLFPGDVLGRDRSLKTPTIMNYSFSIQQNLGFGTVVDVAYAGSLGRHLVWRRNLNPVPAGANFVPANADPTNAGKPLPANFLRPISGYGDMFMIEDASTSNYHSLQVSGKRRFAKGFQFGLAWTWSKAMGYNDDDVVNAAVADVSPLVSPRVWNYGLASFDRTHVLSINYLYTLPKTRWSFAPGRMLLNNWQLSGITRFVSGEPLGVSYTTSVATDVTGTPSQDARVVVTGNPVLPKDERTFSRNFRTDVFRMPAKGTFGNAARTIFRGPGINNWDIAVFRNFPVKERVSAQFRCEMYNAFNHTQFSDLNTTARFDASGAQINQAFGQFTAARRPRYIQLALRVTF